MMDPYLPGDADPPMAQCQDLRPDDLQAANKYLWLLGKIQSEREDLAEFYASELDRLERWYRTETERLDKRAQWFIVALESFHAAVLRTDKKRKTITLPNGTLRARESQPRVVVEDAEEFVAWATRNAPELVFVPEMRPRPALVTDIRRLVKVTEVEATEAARELGYKTVLVPVGPDGDQPLGLTVDPGGVSYTQTFQQEQKEDDEDDEE